LRSSGSWYDESFSCNLGLFVCYETLDLKPSVLTDFFFFLPCSNRRGGALPHRPPLLTPLSLYWYLRGTVPYYCWRGVRVLVPYFFSTDTTVGVGSLPLGDSKSQPYFRPPLTPPQWIVEWHLVTARLGQKSRLSMWSPLKPDGEREASWPDSTEALASYLVFLNLILGHLISAGAPNLFYKSINLSPPFSLGVSGATFFWLWCLVRAEQLLSFRSC